MATPMHYIETRQWLADALDRTASWRREKAEEYQDDPRNGRAATALGMAVHYVRGAGESPGISQFAELVHDCHASDIDLLATGDSFVGAESERIAARYFFDRFAAVPDVEAHERLLQELYEGSLRDLSEFEDMTGIAINASSPLGVRLKAAGLVDEPESRSTDHLGRLATLIDRLAQDGNGVSVMPISKGQPRGGFVSDAVYPNNGWEVGSINPNGGEELAIGPTIAAAVEQALFEIGA